jgi:hypothetical protein
MKNFGPQKHHVLKLALEYKVLKLTSINLKVSFKSIKEINKQHTYMKIKSPTLNKK